jgi:4-hydroxy-4-methyl-2-oxoglutarate aldolase
MEPDAQAAATDLALVVNNGRFVILPQARMPITRNHFKTDHVARMKISASQALEGQNRVKNRGCQTASWNFILPIGTTHMRMNSSRFNSRLFQRAAVLLGLALVTSVPWPLLSAEPEETTQLRQGKNLLSTPVYTEQEDQRILTLFEGLRVSDVCDGMDKAGLQDIGLMDPEIQPLWKDEKEFAHRIIGLAVTARYVPTQRPPAGQRETVDFDKWVGAWYREYSSEPFVPLLRPGSVLVIEEQGGDVGSIGSNNILSWKLKGCRGVISSTTARDTDEIIAERVPLYFKRVGRGIRPGRNEIESVNRPVVCGGVLVLPGDVIVADGDGVVVVPRAKAGEVAAYARKTLDQDKAGRRKAYGTLGLPLDESVR